MNFAKTLIVSKSDLAPPATPTALLTPLIMVLLALFNIFMLFWFRCSGLFVIDLLSLLVLLWISDEEEAVDELDVVCLLGDECCSLLILDECMFVVALLMLMGVMMVFLLRSEDWWDDDWLLNKLLSKPF